MNKKELQEYWKKLLEKLEVTSGDKFEWMKPNEKQKVTDSGFFDLDKVETCLHQEHKPPMHLYIPPGKGYRHICPSCKKEVTLIPPQISF